MRAALWAGDWARAAKAIAAMPEAMCQACGLCAAECPARAISLLNYRDEQLRAKVGALFEQVPA